MDHPDVWPNYICQFNIMQHTLRPCIEYRINAVWLTWQLFSIVMDEPELIPAVIFNISFFDYLVRLLNVIFKQKKEKHANHPY